MCQGCAEVLRIGELLSLIHLGFHIHSQTIAQYGQKESEMRVDRKAEKGI